jgi:hypothetical protein
MDVIDDKERIAQERRHRVSFIVRETEPTSTKPTPQEPGSSIRYATTSPLPSFKQPVSTLSTNCRAARSITIRGLISWPRAKDVGQLVEHYGVRSVIPSSAQRRLATHRVDRCEAEMVRATAVAGRTACARR